MLSPQQRLGASNAIVPNKKIVKIDQKWTKHIRMNDLQNQEIWTFRTFLNSGDMISKVRSWEEV